MSAAEEMDARVLAEVQSNTRCFGEFVAIPSATKGEGLIKFGWNEWLAEQKRFYRERSGHDIVLKSRQMGFSTVELLRDLQFARVYEGVQVLVVVHDGGEKKKLFSRLKMMAERAHAWGLIPEPRTDTQTSITWADNHSGVFVVEAGAGKLAAEKRGRSGSVHRLHATEVAFWGAAHDTWNALEGAMEHGIEAVVESTANGTAGPGAFFHKMVTQAARGKFPPYKLHFYPWFERVGRELDPELARDLAPRTEAEHDIEKKLVGLGCTPRQIAWWRYKVKRMQLAPALQEYPPTIEDAFQTGTDQWLEREHIDWLKTRIDDSYEEHQFKANGKAADPLRIHEPPKPSTLYVMSVDPAEGEGEGDEAAISVMEWRSMRTVACWDSTSTKAGQLGHVAAYIGRKYNNAFIAVEVERKGGGRETLSVIMSTERYPTARVFKRKIGDGKKAKKKPGWSTNKETRPVMFGDIGKAIEDHEIWTPDRKMVSEASTLVPSPKGPVAHNKGKKDGADDGLFVTWAMNLQVRMRINVRGGGVHGVGKREAHTFKT